MTDADDVQESSLSVSIIDGNENGRFRLKWNQKSANRNILEASLQVRNNCKILIESLNGSPLHSNSGLVKDGAIGAGGSDSISRPVKLDAVSPTARHRYDVSSEMC